MHPDREMDKWVVVLDSDPVSQAQLQVCRTHKPDLKGVILCKDEALDPSVSKICQDVNYFPAFCHVERNSCSYGLRSTAAELAALGS
jgi:hypothetical protein